MESAAPRRVTLMDEALLARRMQSCSGKPDTSRRTIEAGANAITYTPPSTKELFSAMMAKYREM